MRGTKDPDAREPQTFFSSEESKHEHGVRFLVRSVAAQHVHLRITEMAGLNKIWDSRSGSFHNSGFTSLSLGQSCFYGARCRPCSQNWSDGFRCLKCSASGNSFRSQTGSRKMNDFIRSLVTWLASIQESVLSSSNRSWCDFFTCC